MYLTTTTSIVLTIISRLIAIAFYTLAERKFLGYLQYRKGPNKPRIIAISIPLADAVKLFLKEEKNTININSKYYLVSPSSIITISLLLWATYPHYSILLFIKFGALYFLAITSIRIYTTFMAGWRSNSKWGLLGALRGIAQSISYEVRISLILILLVIHPLSINIQKITQYYYNWIIVLTIPLAIIWIISILAETHRTPFDFREGESELVSGFNIEYRSSPFAIIFIAEYINILLIRLLSATILIRSCSNIDIIIKTVTVSLIFIWARGSLPRARYDILIDALWKKIIPVTLILRLFIFSFVKLLK